jgi:hypothetical protein
MKVGQNELISGVWLEKKGKDVAQMRMGGEVGYFVIDDDILDSGKSVMLGTRRISAKNKKFQGVFMGKMVGGVMKVYDYDDEMWKVVNSDEWQQAYAEGGGVGGANSRKTINVLEKNYVLNSDIKNFQVEYEIGVFPSGKKDSHNLIITRYSDELGGSQKSVLKILSKSEAKRIFNEINKSNVKDFFQMLEKKS